MQNEYLANRYIKSKVYAPDEILYPKVEGADDLFLLKTGLAVLEINNNDVWVATMIIGANEIIGPSLIYDKDFEFEYRIQALEQCEFLLVDREYLIDHMYVNPKVFITLLEQSVQQEYLFISLYNKKNQSLANRLIDLVVRWEEKFDLSRNGREIELPLTVNQKVLAQFLRASHSRLNELLRGWEREGILIQRNAKGLVFDKEKLYSMQAQGLSIV
ncbi:Crp/Fnr family transcriptional regulator [Listeria cornellensis]|uniref:Cyclic nucleotide-binding domain-containing protein n=1 Tax=Listeria cornellensis FSL F6-0969 TaxID=1265820 RepID=W7BHE7_9LIST|nr:helix-turn-helix domain-containing protein [Listeria cornellensis]EUJ25282.1 hypothetical protein PCORN_18034 [Listeria cornellensis FSL F6-0969]